MNFRSLIQLSKTLPVELIGTHRENPIRFYNWSPMWDHIINIYPRELLYAKTKESRINEHNFKKKIDNLHFLSNNILIRLFKELKNI